MPTAEQIQTRQWAEQALRKGRGREALQLYRKLLEHDKTEGRHYEAWLDGTAASYLALGRARSRVVDDERQLRPLGEVARVSGVGTRDHRNPSSSGANQTGEIHGRPAASAVARVM